MSLWIPIASAAALLVLYFIAESSRKTLRTMLEGRNVYRVLPFPVGESFAAAYRRADGWALARGYRRREVAYVSLVPEEDLILAQGHADPDDTPYWIPMALWWHPEKRTVFSIAQVQNRVHHDFDTALGREGRPSHELTTSDNPDGAVLPRPPELSRTDLPGHRRR